MRYYGYRYLIAFDRENFYRYVIVPSTGLVYLDENNEKALEHMEILEALDLVEKVVPDSSPYDWYYRQLVPEIKMGFVIYRTDRSIVYIGTYRANRYSGRGIKLSEESFSDNELEELIAGSGAPLNTTVEVMEL